VSREGNAMNKQAELVIKTPIYLMRKYNYPKYIFIDFTVVCPWSISWGQSYIGPPDAANGAARNKIKDYGKHFNFLCDQRDQHDLLPEVNSFSLGIVAFECLGSYAKISEGILNMIADALARKQPKYKALEWKGFICTSVNKLLLRNIAEVYQQFISSWTRHTALLAHNQPPSESTGCILLALLQYKTKEWKCQLNLLCSLMVMLNHLVTMCRHHLFGTK
jgi:hypothetical protein